MDAPGTNVALFFSDGSIWLPQRLLFLLVRLFHLFRSRPLLTPIAKTYIYIYIGPSIEGLERPSLHNIVSDSSSSRNQCAYADGPSESLDGEYVTL